MKVLTWNVNGIRAAKVPLKTLLDSLDSDVICFQETKVTRDQLDEASCIVDGYNAYFSYSKKRSGYSGVATFCRNSAVPVAAEEGLSGLLSPPSHNATLIGCHGNTADFTQEELQSLDAEGRGVMTQHQIRTENGKIIDVVIINVYCPRADRENQERFTYKLRFYELLQLRAEALLKAGRHVIVVGDINASHRTIDHCDPDPERLFKLHPSRQWLEKLLYNPDAPTVENQNLSSPKQDPRTPTKDDPPGPTSGQFIDTFRYYYPDRRNAFTCWRTTTGARQTNYGTRIDYIFADKELCHEEFAHCDIMPEVEGSDHCPVKADLKGVCEPSRTYPALCTKFMPEFLGKQQKLSSFFKKLSPSKKLLAQDEELPVVATSTKDTKGLKRINSVESSAINKTKKKQKTGNASGNLLNFFKKKSENTSVNTKVSENVNLVNVASEPKLKLGNTIQNNDQQLTDSKSMNSSNNDKDTLAAKDTQIEIDGQYIPPVTSSQDSVTSEASQNEDKSESRPLNSSQSQGSSLQPFTSSQESTSSESSKDQSGSKSKLSASWQSIFKGLPPPPLCKGHKEPCVLRTVKKAGPNRGKRFYVCTKPEGPKSNPDARCDHFEWMGKKK